MQVKLAVIEGPHVGKEYVFTERDSFLVGRSREAHFSLPRDDMYFSRRHFLIEVNPPRCRLLDLNSRNGTLVNGQRVESAELQHGDQIKAGHTILALTLEQTTASISTGPSAQALAEPPIWESIPPTKAFTTLSPPTRDISAAEPVSTPTLMQPAEAPLAFGNLAIPGYRPLRILGEGGMGIVYLAERTSDNSRVALKLLKTASGVSGKQIQRFQREAEILNQLRHPNIVGFHEAGAVGNAPYIVMEFVDGVDADTILKKHGPLPVPTAVKYVCQLLEALEYAHSRRLVHRDIKPANMLIEKRGQEAVVRLADFGLARVYEASQLSGLTLPGDVGGTIAYMAPEQVTHFRNANAASDQYSAAATLYHLISGKHIFDFGNGVNPLLQILTEEPVPLRKRRPDVPEELAEVVHRALAKEPGERFQDTGEFRRDLMHKL